MARETTAYDRKLEKILRGAAIVFAERGYHRASIRDIARATGVSLSGLYYYFESKEELLFLIQDRALDQLVEGAERRLDGVDDPRERLRRLIDNQLRYFIRNMPEMKVLSHEADSLEGSLRDRVDARKRHLTRMARAILREVDPQSPLDERVSTFALFGMMNWLYVWYRPDRDVDEDRLVHDLTEIFMRGYARRRMAIPDLRIGPVTEEVEP